MHSIQLDTHLHRVRQGVEPPRLFEHGFDQLGINPVPDHVAEPHRAVRVQELFAETFGARRR